MDKDCKHEKLGIDFYEQTVYCTNEDCGKIMGDDETIVLTKEQHQLYVDLEKAVRIALKSYHTPGDDAYSDEMISLQFLHTISIKCCSSIIE